MGDFAILPVYAGKIVKWRKLAIFRTLPAYLTRLFQKSSGVSWYRVFMHVTGLSAENGPKWAIFGQIDFTE